MIEILSLIGLLYVLFVLVWLLFIIFAPVFIGYLLYRDAKENNHTSPIGWVLLTIITAYAFGYTYMLLVIGFYLIYNDIKLFNK